MDAMQYGTTLPANHDMQMFRDIVARNGHLLDDRAGLGFKAYLMRERGKLGSPVNYYGSFYLWNDAAAMARFLVGGGAFERIIRGLSRLTVEHWIGLACLAGANPAREPKRAVRTITRLPQDLDCDDDGLGLSRFIESSCRDFETSAHREGLHTAALALDTRNWTLIRFEAWNDAMPQQRIDDSSECYEVLHVSTPGIAALPKGRAW